MNRRSHPLHDAWRNTMRIAWREHPTLVFIVSRGNEIVSLGGFVRPDMSPTANENAK